MKAVGPFSDAYCLTLLDGVSFNVGASTPVTSLNGWSPTGGLPAYSVSHGVVRLQGGVMNSVPTATNPLIAVLPASRAGA